jgi:hypothetical protein
MASGLVDRGRLLLNAEPLLAAFQRWLAQQLTTASASGIPPAGGGGLEPNP